MEDSSWVLLDDRKTLAESGFSQANAKAQAPASIGLIVTTGQLFTNAINSEFNLPHDFTTRSHVDLSH